MQWSHDMSLMDPIITGFGGIASARDGFVAGESLSGWDMGFVLVIGRRMSCHGYRRPCSAMLADKAISADGAILNAIRFSSL
jgi:hypothetical protein